jgi:putative ABC transport system permease protein
MSWQFIWRWLWRDIRQGEALIVLLALTIAISAMTAVGLFTNRVEKLLEQQANSLLAADAVLNADHPISTQYIPLSRQYQLAIAETITFPSMVLTTAKSQLVTVKGVSMTYPLRGEIQLENGRDVRAVKSGPKPGEAWADNKLVEALSVKVGEHITVGHRRFLLTQVVIREPDAVMDLYNFVPRLLINTQDLPSTGLLQPGSRIRYRLLVAGTPDAIKAWQQAVTSQLKRGERIEKARESRPELNTAWERAETFLRLAALSSVCLAAAALLLTTRRYVARHLDSAAILRTLGGTQRNLMRLFVWQFVLISIAAVALGNILGWVAQFLLVQMIEGAFPLPLPAHDGLPFVLGALAGVLLLLGFMVPPLINLSNVPALRVLRRELAPQAHTIILSLCGALALFLLIRWQAGAWSLACLFIGGMLITLLAAAIVGWCLLRLALLIRGHLWRMSIRNLLRHKVWVLLQIAALALGVMAMLLLTVVREDLISAWEKTLPADAPNRFVINIQPQNVEPLIKIFQAHKLEKPTFHPMLRARLISIQGKAVHPQSYLDERTQGLAEREFNLSWGNTLRQDNYITVGRALNEADKEFSVEEDIARRLGIKLGDVITFNIAGIDYSAPVTSLRKVSWDSFRVNFFVTGTRTLLEQESSLITSFYLPPEKHSVAYALTQAMPNLTVIDVDTILGEVRRVIQQASQALQVVFIFCIAAGWVLLLALLYSLYDERLQDVAILRVLGASNQVLCKTLVFEWLLLGGISGLVAGTAATGVGWLAARQLLNIDSLYLNWRLPLIASIGTAIIVLLVSLPFLRRLLRTSPVNLLRIADPL